MLTLSLLAASAAARAADHGPNLEARAISRVQPAYPALAKRHGMEGTITVGIEVGANGAVLRATFLEGNVIFRSASVEAAKRWVFRTTAEPTSGHIDFRFSIHDE